jgi:hypothetical protein
MRVGNLNITRDALTNACRWIAPFIAFWSPALLIRAGKVTDLRKGDLLTRTRVAAMEPALARRLYSWLLSIFERELAALSDRIAMDSWQEALLETLPVVLSRLAFKAGAEDLKRTFPLVLAFHGKAAIRAHIRLHESSKPWFRRLFDAAESELLLEWLPQLIRAPLFEEGTHGLIPPGEVWPDPMRHFPVERSREAVGTPGETITRINEATDWLLRRAASESGEARQRALLRLTYVHRAELMTDAQQRQLGELLWADLASNGLPNLQNSAVFGFLHLPVPSGVDVTALVKNYLLSLDADGFVVRKENARPSIAIHRVIQPLIYEASLASKPPVQLRGEALGAVEWTPEEAQLLYAKARKWWEHDKEAFAIAAEGAPFGTMGADPVLNTVNVLGNYLSRAVLPYMDWAGEDDWAELEKWIHDLRNHAAPPSIALPYILLHRPDRAPSVAAILLDDLNSETGDACASGATAVRHWLHLSVAKAVPVPPPELLSTLMERVSFRRKAGIRRCLGQLAYIVLDLPEMVSIDQVCLLIGSLTAWHHAIVLPLADGDATEFREEERPDLRVVVARLAGALKIWWDSQRTDLPEPKALGFWRDVCASDPLPEVRRAIETWSHGDS